MKKIVPVITLLLITLSFFGCKKKEDTDSTPANGSVVFWKNGVDGYNYIDIYIAGAKQGTIYGNQGGAPACDASEFVTCTAAPNTYNFTASEQGTTRTWSGTVTITSNKCSSYQIH